LSFVFVFCLHSEIYENHRKKEDEALAADPQPTPAGLFYARQLVRNSCGTMALIHAVLNNKDIELKEGSIIQNYYDKARDLKPEERGKLLEEDKSFIETHQALAVEGQTAAPASDAVIDNHFIALVNHEGNLYELDGRKNFPIKHGATKSDTFLNDAAAVCKEFMARDEKEVRFTIMALAAAADE